MNEINELAKALKYHSFDMKQNADGDMVRELFVLYYDSKAKHGLTRWLKADFQHCAMVTFDGIEYTLVSHGLSYNYHQVLPIEHDCGDLIMIQFIKDALSIDVLTVQKVCCIIKPVNRVKLPLLIDSCVESVKRYLGIGKRSVLTPYQLYKHLKNIGVVKHEYTKDTKKRS